MIEIGLYVIISLIVSAESILMFKVRELVIDGIRFAILGVWNNQTQSYLGWGKVSWASSSDPNLVYSVKGRLILSEDGRILVSGIALLQQYDHLGRLCFEEKGFVDLDNNDVSNLKFSVSLKSFYQASELNIEMNYPSIRAFEDLEFILEQFQKINDYFNGAVHELLLNHADKINNFDRDLAKFLSVESNQSLEGFFRYIGQYRHTTSSRDCFLPYQCGNEVDGFGTEEVILSKLRISTMPPSQHNSSELARILFAASTSSDSQWDVLHRSCISIQKTGNSLVTLHKAARYDQRNATGEQWWRCSYEERYFLNSSVNRQFQRVVYERHYSLSSYDYAEEKTSVIDYQDSTDFSQESFGAFDSCTRTVYPNARAVMFKTSFGVLNGVQISSANIPHYAQSNLSPDHSDVVAYIIDKNGSAGRLVRNAIGTQGAYEIKFPGQSSSLVCHAKGIMHNAQWEEPEYTFSFLEPAQSQCEEVDDATPVEIGYSTSMVLHTGSSSVLNNESEAALPQSEIVPEAGSTENKINNTPVEPYKNTNQQEFWTWLSYFQSITEPSPRSVVRISPLISFLMKKWHKITTNRTHDLSSSDLKVLHDETKLTDLFNFSIALILKDEGIRYARGLLGNSSFFKPKRSPKAFGALKLNEDQLLILQPDLNQDSSIYRYHIQPYSLLQELQNLLINSPSNKLILRSSTELYFLMIRLLTWPDVSRIKESALPTNSIGAAQFIKSDAFITYLIDVVQNYDTEQYVDLADSCFSWSNMSTQPIKSIVAQIVRVLLTTPEHHINFGEYLRLMNGAPFPNARFKGIPVTNHTDTSNGFFFSPSANWNALPENNDFITLFRHHPLYERIEALAHNMPEHSDALILLAFILGQMAHDAINGNNNKYNPHYNPLVTCIGFRHAMSHGVECSTGFLQRAVEEVRVFVAGIHYSAQEAYSYCQFNCD